MLTWVKNLKGNVAVVLVHGFSYDPDGEENKENKHDAFNTVYANPKDTELPFGSWLPLVGETDESGNYLREVAVPFSWTTLGKPKDAAKAGWANSYQYGALDLTIQASHALALIISALSRAGATIDILAHSLGTRLTMQTLSLLTRNGLGNAVRRVVLMGGAEFSIDARDASQGGGYDVFSLVNRGDTVLHWGASKAVHPFRQNNMEESFVLGRDGVKATPHWIDIQTNRKDNETGQRSAFDRWFMDHYGVTLSGDPTEKRGTHWSYYLQSGNRVFVKALFSAETVTANGLREAGLIDGVDRKHYGDLTASTPPTPQTFAERQAMIHNDSQGDR